MDRVRVLIVDDHPMMREALREAIQKTPDFEIVGDASNGKQAIRLMSELHPDVVLMDLYLPDIDGIATSSEIMKHNPAIRILMITSASEGEKALAAIRAGVAGYITKDAPRSEILKALRDVAAGQGYIPPIVATRITSALRQEEVLQRAITPRESTILKLVGEGHTNREIADALTLSEATVRVHISNLMQKFYLKNRSQLALHARHYFSDH